MIQFTQKPSNPYFLKHSEKDFLLNLISSGCEGTKLEIHPIDRSVHPVNGMREIAHNLDIDIHIYTNETTYKNIDGSVLTYIKNAWIVGNNPNINTRCGCGKSFSFKSGDITADKIALLRSKLKRKHSHH